MAIELDNKEFQDIWKLVNTTHTSVFMTGRAGTGKSTFLRYIVENIKKKTVVLAPTGIAAVNVGGVTLHSFFCIPLEPLVPDDSKYSTPAKLKERLKLSSTQIALLRNVELIVIDEVSMVRADVLDFIDRVLRVYVHNGNKKPFGGKQLLLVGDAYQLEPVVKDDEWSILSRFYQTPYFFGARVFSEISLVQIELKKVYRQKDEEFLKLLDRIRTGQTTPADINLINRQTNETFEPPHAEMYLTLTTTRDAADYINSAQLKRLKTEEKTYEGIVTGDFPDNMHPTSRVLPLKVDAQVVFIRNDRDYNGPRRWFNGTIGRVVGFAEDGIWVEIDDEEVDEDGEAHKLCHFVERETWENIRYRYDDKEKTVKSEVLGTFTQIPVKLAWAITIHKSQGLTLDRVIIDLGRGAFACGQVYVALSRCRTLDGIVLRKPVFGSDIKINSSVVRFSSMANDQTLIESELNHGKALTLTQQALTDYRKGNYQSAVAQMLDAFALEGALLNNPVVRRFIAQQTNAVVKLNNQIDSLLNARNEQQEKLENFAKEYYMLAVECLKEYKDSVSAKANIDKAIDLSPNYVDALALRAEIDTTTGNPDDALSDIDQALKSKTLTKKQHARLLRLRANILISQRRWERAERTLQRLIKYHEQADYQTLMQLSDVYKHMGDTVNAKFYRDAAKRKKDKEEQ